MSVAYSRLEKKKYCRRGISETRPFYLLLLDKILDNMASGCGISQVLKKICFDDFLIREHVSAVSEPYLKYLTHE